MSGMPMLPSPERLRPLIAQLESGLLERSAAVRLALLAQQMAAAHAASVQVMAALLARLQTVRADFAALPVDAALAGGVPEPLRRSEAAAA